MSQCSPKSRQSDVNYSVKFDTSACGPRGNWAQECVYTSVQSRGRGQSTSLRSRNSDGNPWITRCPGNAYFPFLILGDYLDPRVHVFHFKYS